MSKENGGPALCQRKKCGEYNMLRCVREAGHSGECCFVVDHENDYAFNKAPKQQKPIAERSKP